jgi:YcxB-like protein
MENTTFRYIEDDIVASNRCYAAHHWRSRRMRVTAAVVLLALAAVSASLATGRGDSILLPALAGLAFGMIIIATIYGLSHWHIGRYARKNFAEQRNLADEFHFTWGDEGFESTSQRGSTRLAWDDLVRWDEAETVLLLYIAERMYLAVPKRALSPGQLDSLRGHLSRALPDGRRKA